MTTATATTICAAVACVVNVRAAVHGPPSTRRVFAAVAVLAAIYTAAYLVLALEVSTPLVNGADRGEWSHRMIHFGFFAWVIVWILPAVRVTAHERRQVSEANRVIDDHAEG